MNLAVAKWFAKRRFWLTAAIAISGAVVIAGSGLLLEMVTGQDHFGPRAWWSRLAITGVSLALLLWLLWIRQMVSSERGTLFYIRVIDEWMNDDHLDLERATVQAYGDERVVSEHVWGQPRAGVLDIADQVTDVGRRLDATMNEDDVSTGFHLAPNMLLPVALSLGYGLHVWQGTCLVEFRKAPESKRPPKPQTWTLLSRDPAAEASRTFARPQIRRGEPSRPASKVRSVLVTARSTGEKAAVRPRGIRPDHWLEVGVFTGADSGGAVQPVFVTPDPTEQVARGTARVHPQVMTDAIVEAIDEALLTYPAAQIYLLLRVPKTVALAVGYRLSGPGRGDEPAHKRPPSLRHPWRRLVPLLADQSAPDFSPQASDPICTVARVHPAQPPAKTLARKAKKAALKVRRSYA